MGKQKRSGRNEEHSGRSGRYKDQESRGGKNRKRKSRTGKICSILGTVLIVLVILLCSMLVLPGVIGYHMYDVISGSMEPAVKVGSLIYVQDGRPEDVEEDEIIAFYSDLEDGGIITHRVVKNNSVSGIFRTKGDANDQEDPNPIDYDNYIGTVKLAVPYMGKILTMMTSFYGKIAAACVVLIGVMLNIIGTNLSEKIY